MTDEQMVNKYGAVRFDKKSGKTIPVGHWDKEVEKMKEKENKEFDKLSPREKARMRAREVAEAGIPRGDSKKKGIAEKMKRMFRKD